MTDMPITIWASRSHNSKHRDWDYTQNPADVELGLPNASYTRSDLCITRAAADALVAAERAIWTQAIETYFDATAVMDIERHVERIRKGEKL